MLGLVVSLVGDAAWEDIRDRPIIHCADGAPIRVAVLPMGLASGRPSVAIRIDLPAGQTVVAETSARLFCAAARAILARYPDLFEDKPHVEQ